MAGAPIATQIQICGPDKQLHPLQHQQRDDQTATGLHITTTSHVALRELSQAPSTASTIWGTPLGRGGFWGA